MSHGEIHDREPSQVDDVAGHQEFRGLLAADELGQAAKTSRIADEVPTWLKLVHTY